MVHEVLNIYELSPLEEDFVLGERGDRVGKVPRAYIRIICWSAAAKEKAIQGGVKPMPTLVSKDSWQKADEAKNARISERIESPARESLLNQSAGILNHKGIKTSWIANINPTFVFKIVHLTFWFSDKTEAKTFQESTSDRNCFFLSEILTSFHLSVFLFND